MNQSFEFFLLHQILSCQSLKYNNLIIHSGHEGSA